MADPWYQDGLQFTCTRCGNCCTGASGAVWVTDEELTDIADFLGEPAGEIEARHTHLIRQRRSLREKLNGDCVFWASGRGCTIYKVRPKQCRTWPFWESNLETPEEWERTRGGCPGAGQGDLIPVEEITRRLKVIRI